MAYTAQTRTNLADVYDLAILAENLANTEGEMTPSVATEYFYVKPTQYKSEKFSKIGGPASMTATNEGSDYTEKELVQGYDHEITPLKYTAVIPLTEEAVEDDPKGVLNAPWLAEQARMAYTATLESAAAGILNAGFNSTTSPDAAYLFANGHTVTSGGTSYSNLITSALDAEGTALVTAFRKIRENFYDTGGRRLDFRNWVLVVPPALWPIALKATQAVYGNQSYGSPNVAQTGELMGRIRPVEVPDLSDPAAWFLAPDPKVYGEKTSLIMLDRQPLRLTAKRAQANQDYEIYCSVRFVCGVKGFHVLGSTGAGA